MKARYINPNTNFDALQLAEYEESLKVYRDLKGVVDTSYEEGLEEGVMIGEERGLKKGMEEGEKKKALEMARMMKKEGEPVDRITRYTGLTPEEIENL